MMNPDLGEQVAHVLVALEKATPELLEMATRSFRMSAALTGAAYLVVIVFALVVVLRATRWFREESTQDSYQQREGLMVIAAIVIALCALAFIVGVANLPEQLNQYLNARYYAVCDLLRRVKP